MRTRTRRPPSRYGPVVLFAVVLFDGFYQLRIMMGRIPAQDRLEIKALY